MTKLRLLIALFCLPLLTATTQASILDDFNSGVIVTDFLFDDVANTQIQAAFNSADTALFDADADNDDVVTNGAGQLDASGKANTDFGTNYVDVDPLNAGRVIGLYDVSWDFDESVYDPAQDEEFRMTFITFDPRSTFVTAEIFFTRTSATEVTLHGNGVGTGSSDTPDVVLGSSGSLLTMLDANLSDDTFELWYSADNGVSFVSGGIGNLDPARGVESIRLVLNEDFSDDALLIERFAASWVIPEPSTALVLVIGLVALGSVQRLHRTC
ncbi:hypothetical protein [Aeoliella sp.]|uniref:hypothetical protein n=1 Tax=Aeoliella sp. TaxID=2795800 RepID=UPI003CCBD568